MPRKSASRKNAAKKALKMHAVIGTRKRAQETEGIDNNDLTTSAQKTAEDSTLIEVFDATVLDANENQDKANSNQVEVYEGLNDCIFMEPSETTVIVANENQDDANSIRLNISSNSEENPRPIEGRRIINIGHFFTKLKEIANHGPLNCGLGCVEIVGERQIGLSSKFKLKCKLCNVIFFIESDSPDDLYVNHSAVAGTIAIGAGHWQLQELSAALNLPLITPKLYQRCHAKISEEVKKISIDSMNQAAKKEKEMAIAEGRIDKNGIPIIDVIVDGCWSKRSYKKNYSALSGAAAIIGKRTGEVLFLGVRNKYCCICAKAEKNKIDPKAHLCYKNYNGPSTGMESAILLEGFKCSIEMHGLIYGRMVSDGDSNTYAKLLKSRPYNHVTVEKIECRNHVLRNLCNKLTQLQTDTKYPLQYRKQLTQKKIMILRKTIRSIINTYKTDSESERRCNIEPFYNDLLSAHLHTFGDHSRCKASFCTEKNKSDLRSEAADLNFFTSTLWSRITFIMSNVASHAPSLIHDVDSNLVERFNSIVAKLAGGKRTNLSFKGSYQTRCQAALVSFNSHKLMSSIYKRIQGRSPTGKIKLLEKSRLKKMIDLRKVNRKKNRLLFSKGNNDANYGEKCEKPDMTEEIFEKEKNTFLQNLSRSEEEKDKIQKETVLQSMCSEWMDIRRTILTASNFGRVIKRRENVSCANLVKDILYKDSLSHVTSIKHGRDNEKKAIEQLKIQENIDIKPCGLFIDKEIPFLGATPDGVVGENMIVEIKCPVTAFKEGIDEAIKKRKLNFYKFDKNGVLQINKTHNWYFQIQGQLHITNKTKCLLGIWYGENEPLKTEIITKDDSLWDCEMENKLKKFYLHCLLPELVDSRYARNMPIRDPEYIEKALKEKQENNDAKRKINKDKETPAEENQETTYNNNKKRRIDDKENYHKHKNPTETSKVVKTNKGFKKRVFNENVKEIKENEEEKILNVNSNREDSDVILDHRNETSETKYSLKDISQGLCGEDNRVVEECDVEEYSVVYDEHNRAIEERDVEEEYSVYDEDNRAIEECDVEEEYSVVYPGDKFCERQLNFTEF